MTLKCKELVEIYVSLKKNEGNEMPFTTCVKVLSMIDTLTPTFTAFERKQNEIVMKYAKKENGELVKNENGEIMVDDVLSANSEIDSVLNTEMNVDIEYLSKDDVIAIVSEKTPVNIKPFIKIMK